MVTIQIRIGDAVAKLRARARRATGSLKARLQTLIDALIELVEALAAATVGPHTEPDLKRLLDEVAALLDAIEASAETDLTEAVEATLATAETSLEAILVKLGRRPGPN
ncbi:hypothetical protein GUR46_03990 [Stenotrophomonas maltophilia]|uniref:hypothetical protein n=1 Tax=Stenotrophomonas maltophilia TaxID=40324 RepID=UPI001F1AEFD5|nr:hypothetical protein [Stenotrophomonas maltophilia]MCF3528047.1 hypothetical protein [Stenotrophomonas maltophilia]MCF3531931.1 hypothetical protein [Stenotrophomonas maltophilia]